ncbi:MAG: LrgB family protein [Alicyclobacillus sp.]|nr:LrgB family protein [Alicyclobacillus sp.]
MIATLGVYAAARWLYRRWPVAWLSPVLVCTVVLGVLLCLRHQSYSVYAQQTQWLGNLLQPAMTAFAIPLYRQRKALVRAAPVLLVSLLAGTCTAVLTSVGLAKVFHLGNSLALDLAPRSVTTPVAMSIAQHLGANPVLTAAFVTLTGLGGSVFGPWWMRRLHLRSPVARGSLMGMGAHGIGTARAFELGHEEGTYASLAMILAAAIGVLLTPPLAHWAASRLP